nr:MAG TPA: hypothetical protein [Caudoviricetes sp.]
MKSTRMSVKRRDGIHLQATHRYTQVDRSGSVFGQRAC